MALSVVARKYRWDSKQYVMFTVAADGVYVLLRWTLALARRRWLWSLVAAGAGNRPLDPKAKMRVRSQERNVPPSGALRFHTGKIFGGRGLR